MPSLVTLVWALAGLSVSASALTARPSALNDFDISRLPLLISSLSILLGPLRAKAGPVTFAVSPESHSRHRALAIHRVDLAGVTLVHEIALQLHGRRQLLVLRRQLALDQKKFLDGLDAGEIGIDRL